MAIEEKNLLSFLKSYARTNPLPLDSSEVYDSIAEAEAYAESAVAYAGQTIKVLQNGGYVSYVLNPSGVEGKLELDRVGVTASEVKNYVQVVDALPQTNQEQGVVYVNTSDNKGYIYTGAGYKTIFEQVDGLQGELDSLGEADTALSNRLDTIEGEGEGSVKKALADAKTYTDGLKDAIDEEVALKANAADVYTKEAADAAVAKAINEAGHLQREIVAQLPEVSAAKETTIYMIPKADGDYAAGEAQHYTEYMLINGVFEKIGDTAVDLKDYAKTADVTSAIGEAKTELQGKLDTTNAAVEAAQTQADKGVEDAAAAQKAAEAAQAKADANETALAETDKKVQEQATKIEEVSGNNTQAIEDAKSELTEAISTAKDAAIAHTDEEIKTVTAAVNTKLDADKAGVDFTEEVPTLKAYIDSQNLADQKAASEALAARVGEIDGAKTIKQYVDEAVDNSAMTITEF